jgi:hypothetical protein
MRFEASCTPDWHLFVADSGHGIDACGTFGGDERASAPTASMRDTAAPIASGAAALIPKSRLAINRPRARAAGSPILTPARIKLMLCPSTMRRTDSGVPPSAKRIPSSLVFRATVYESTP